MDHYIYAVQTHVLACLLYSKVFKVFKIFFFPFLTVIGLVSAYAWILQFQPIIFAY